MFLLLTIDINDCKILKNELQFEKLTSSKTLKKTSRTSSSIFET